MSLAERGESLAELAVDLVEGLLTDIAVDAVTRLGRARRVSPHHLALQVPGLCHTHCPDRHDHRAECAYCRRRGNCFADGADGETEVEAEAQTGAG
jgi:hypothetical protein